MGTKTTIKILIEARRADDACVEKSAFPGLSSWFPCFCFFFFYASVCCCVMKKKRVAVPYVITFKRCNQCLLRGPELFFYAREFPRQQRMSECTTRKIPNETISTHSSHLGKERTCGSVFSNEVN